LLFLFSSRNWRKDTPELPFEAPEGTNEKRLPHSPPGEARRNTGQALQPDTHILITLGRQHSLYEVRIGCNTAARKNLRKGWLTEVPAGGDRQMVSSKPSPEFLPRFPPPPGDPLTSSPRLFHQSFRGVRFEYLRNRAKESSSMQIQFGRKSLLGTTGFLPQRLGRDS